MSPQFDGTPQPMPMAVRTVVQPACQHCRCRGTFARNTRASVLALPLAIAIVTFAGVSDEAALSYRPPFQVPERPRKTLPTSPESIPGGPQIVGFRSGSGFKPTPAIGTARGPFRCHCDCGRYRRLWCCLRSRPIDGRAYRRTTLTTQYSFRGFEEGCRSIGSPAHRAPS